MIREGSRESFPHGFLDIFPFEQIWKVRVPMLGVRLHGPAHMDKHMPLNWDRCMGLCGAVLSWEQDTCHPRLRTSSAHLSDSELYAFPLRRS